MNVLMTGATPLQCGHISTRRRIDAIYAPTLIVNQLVGLYQDVEQRPVEVGEDLSGYDAFFVCVSPITSITARHALGALWTMYWARMNGTPLVVYFDDWQFPNVFGSMKRFSIRQVTKTMGGSYFYLGNIETAAEHIAELEHIASEFLNPGSVFWERRAIACWPKYSGWGDRTIVDQAMGFKTMEYDPSYMIQKVIQTELPPDAKKQERWMLAALTDQSRWVAKQGIQWPVDYYGPKALNAPALKSEFDVFRTHAKYQGALAPAYPHDGSGWWRSRFDYAANSGTVLVCGPKDAAALGPAYQVSGREVEAMSLPERQATARLQRDTFLSVHEPSYEFSYKQLAGIIEAAIEKSRNG